MRTEFKYLTFVTILSLLVISFSCNKEDVPEKKRPEGTETIIDLNWNTHADGQYGTSEAQKDFGNMSGWQPSRVSLSNNAIKVKLLANELSGSGGIVANVNLQPAAEYRVKYDVMFPEDFIWGRGGKVGFGFRFGDGNTGCDKADDGNGGSARIMWYTNDSGITTLRPYLYYYDMPDDCGDNPGSVYPASGSIEKGKWYTIEMYAKSNLSENKDGHIKIAINGTVVLDSSIRWTNKNSKRLINRLAFSTFRGGSQTHWMVDEDTYIYLDNLKVERIY